MLARAAELNRATGLAVPLLQADAGALPLGDGSVDLACSAFGGLPFVADAGAVLAEVARVLRPGGRFVGVYNCRDHLAELWELVADSVWDREFFGCESGPDVLRRYFRRVERLDAVTEAMWETRQAAQMFLDTFVEMIGPLTAPSGPYPIKATRRNCVLIAEKD
jgi:ubiquinone/menaquinone biosynthesis C-methylase UbiE